jgi:hypothetical protein
MSSDLNRIMYTLVIAATTTKSTRTIVPNGMFRFMTDTVPE